MRVSHDPKDSQNGIFIKIKIITTDVDKCMENFYFASMPYMSLRTALIYRLHLLPKPSGPTSSLFGD